MDNKKQWAWLTEKHFNELEEFNDDLHFSPESLDRHFPVVLSIEEGLYLALMRDGRPHRLIAADMGVTQRTISNITKRHHKPKLGVAKKILQFCARFNIKILLMKEM